MPTTSFTALFSFFFTICTFSSTSMFMVKNSKAPVMKMENQPLTLKCTAEYDEKYFGSIVVSWSFAPASNNYSMQYLLNDPDLYLLLINETKIGEKRQRDALITFEHLDLNNSGLYQCNAKCVKTGTSAMGHIINVTVTGDPNKGQKIQNYSNRCNVDVILLTICVILGSIKSAYFTK